MAVRSRRLFGPTLNTLPGVAQVVYTVPEGRTATFSLLRVVNIAAADRLAQVYVNGFGLTNYLIYELLLWRGPGVRLEGLRLNPGDTLLMTSPNVGDLVISGYGSLLLGAPA